jgi:hypothetical protein
MLYGDVEGSNGEALFVLINHNDLGSNISNAVGSKVTLFPYVLPFQSLLQTHRI